MGSFYHNTCLVKLVELVYFEEKKPILFWDTLLLMLQHFICWVDLIGLKVYHQLSFTQSFVIFHLIQFLFEIPDSCLGCVHVSLTILPGETEATETPSILAKPIPAAIYSPVNENWCVLVENIYWLNNGWYQQGSREILQQRSVGSGLSQMYLSQHRPSRPRGQLMHLICFRPPNKHQWLHKPPLQYTSSPKPQAVLSS